MAKKPETAVVAEPVVTEEKAKRVPPTNSPLPSVQPIGEDEIGAPDLAKMLGVDPREFRAFLRATQRDMNTAKGTRYAWKKTDKAGIQKIVAEFKKWKADKPVKAEKAAKEEKKAEAAKEEAVVDTTLEVADVTTESEEISIDDLDLEIK